MAVFALAELVDLFSRVTSGDIKVTFCFMAAGSMGRPKQDCQYSARQRRFHRGAPQVSGHPLTLDNCEVVEQYMGMANPPVAIPHPVPPALAELISQRLRVIGDPMRIRLLDHLREEEASVASLTETLEATQQNVSKHLQVLHQAGIVGRRKDGTSVLYRIVDASVFELCELVCRGLQRQLSDLSALVQGEPL